jgi:hypothetical protein
MALRLGALEPPSGGPILAASSSATAHHWGKGALVNFWTPASPCEVWLLLRSLLEGVGPQPGRGERQGNG